MSQPEGVDTFEVSYRADEIGVEGASMITTTAIVEMLQWDWLELTILQLFSV